MTFRTTLPSVLPSLSFSIICFSTVSCSSPPGGAEGQSGGASATGGNRTGAGASGGSSSGGQSATGGQASGGSGAGASASGGAAAGGTSNQGPGGTAGGGESSTGGRAAGGSGGSSTGGSSAGGSSSSGGTGPTAGGCTVGAGTHSGEGNTQERYLDADVQRDAQNYTVITNGWGQNWESHDLSWLGTKLTINSFEGSRQSNGAPAGFPAVFCGRYSDQTSQECGLPAARDSVTALPTAAKWSHPEENGVYNVAYDVWIGDASGGGFGSGLESYFMVWLYDPEEEGPAGSLQEEGVSVEGVPGVWNIVAGEVNNLPIVNYVRAEGDEVHELAFDMMNFIDDAEARNLEFPGNDILSVALGFEVWQGPVTNLKLDDFCVEVQ